MYLSCYRQSDGQRYVFWSNLPVSFTPKFDVKKRQPVKTVVMMNLFRIIEQVLVADLAVVVLPVVAFALLPELSCSH